MKIAISTDGDQVSAHFGRCPSFTIADIENGKLMKKEIIDNPGHHPGFLPQFLRGKEVDCIIAGGMGQRAEGLFAEQRIKIVVGISGSIDEVIDKLLKGTLEGGESLCSPGSGRGYGLDKTECEHPDSDNR
ncbi:MAG: NifB/NifX family molybdenum-iron cluster-binding protein [Candidatus Omnitrophota bacterium]|nr:NifB/NifX family molybdenum-iron cluster-binding protein [Candidatus Omnitrophota bacterium]